MGSGLDVGTCEGYVWKTRVLSKVQIIVGKNRVLGRNTTSGNLVSSVSTSSFPGKEKQPRIHPEVSWPGKE